MASNRIKGDADGLRDQLTQAIAGITGAGVSWPATAPTLIEVTTARDNLATSITDTENKENQWKVAAQLKRTRMDAGTTLMKKIDEATDMLYGPSGVEKNNFGLPPKGSAMAPLQKLIEIRLTDGPFTGSLRFDWESIQGAAYEVQWATTSDFATVIGSATSASTSEYIISGLVPGTQYWVRVRPLRGGDLAPWSDPATRVAPL